MAFPLEQSQLLYHLRTSYLILGEDSEYFKRIILNNDLNLINNQSNKINDGKGNTGNITNLIIQNSPPITFDLSHHIKNSINDNHNNHNHHSHHHRHRKNLINNRSRGHHHHNHHHPPNSNTDDNDIRKKSVTTIDGTQLKTNESNNLNNNDNINDNNKNNDNITSKSTTNFSSIFDLDSNTNYNTTGSLSSNSTTNQINPSSTLESLNKNNSNKKKTTFILRNPLNNKNQKKSKPKTMSKIPIVRLFKSGKQYNSSDSDISNDDNFNSRYNVNTIDESREESTDDYSTENDPTNNEIHDNSDVLTIDSDFGVPIDKNGKVVKIQKNQELNKEVEIKDKQSINEHHIHDNNNEETDTEEDDEFDEDDDDFDEEYSNDSEFTDLDNDTILDSSLQSNSYTSELGKVIDKDVNVLSDYESRDMRKKKRSDTISNHTIPENFDPHFLDNQDFVKYRLMNHESFGNLTMSEQPSLIFNKVEPKLQSPPKSNLSTIIHSKYKSTNVNPLNYYLFVDGLTSDNSSRVSLLNIFLPPKTTPTLENISVTNTVTVVDCIGFILLNLMKLPEFSKSNDYSYLNPNYWRLELVDEDGENYGSFGILDRNRILASYNNPKELALCRVNDVKEIDSYEKKSPLPIEFKQNLSAYERKKNSINHIQALEGIPQIELLIGVYEYDNSGIPDKVNFKVPATYTMGQVLKEFCMQKGLITTKYRFKVVDEKTDKSRFVKDVEICENLHSKILELVPSEAKFNLVLESEEDKQMIGATTSATNITPADFTLPYITPNQGHLSNKLQKLTVSDNQMPLITPEQLRRESVNSTKSIKEAITSNKYLEDIISGNNPQLPTNINSIYFKWNILKSNSKMKKMKIKTFTEKMFIIDGDYIHITPLDDVLSKNIGNDSSIAAHQSHFQHHNLNHHINKTANTKTYSFHITQILKSKQYSKTPNHFRIIVQKQQSDQINNDVNNNNEQLKLKDLQLKKFYLVAESEAECSEIINKLQWVLQVYKLSSGAI
ncbi:AVO1 [Candida jiufengensis]|uniref:AVO1 n=1 Tax=Candida jiufengensis TaxID=497108 RepID=UPI00222509B6|nr:AVO1 [Candida jiufengensis]KAI5954644.1 AVO1 [Candida jiufengensis]